MKKVDEYIENLYLKNQYIVKNPLLHEEDAAWKISKILPLVDRFLTYINKHEINLLDVGGGTGTILNRIPIYIEANYSIKVNKFTLDLSPGMVEIQKERNSDLKRALNENIAKTSLENKEIDLTLMIDVLEHIANSTGALEEVKRISNFAIFKVPLEDNLVNRIWNFIKRGKLRQSGTEMAGHINFYNVRKLRQQIERHTGQVLALYFTNVFDYFRSSEHYKNKMKAKNKIINYIATYIYSLSPKLCALIFTDFVVFLVKCY